MSMYDGAKENTVTAVVVSRRFVFVLERTLTLISPYTHAKNTQSYLIHSLS